MQLQIDLREGFHRTPVRVLLDGRELRSAAEVTTRTQLGLAQVLEVEVERTPALLVVEFPASARRIEHRLEGSGPWYLGIDLDEAGTPALRASDEPFGYV